MTSKRHIYTRTEIDNLEKLPQKIIESMEQSNSFVDFRHSFFTRFAVQQYRTSGEKRFKFSLSENDTISFLFDGLTTKNVKSAISKIFTKTNSTIDEKIQSFLKNISIDFKGKTPYEKVGEFQQMILKFKNTLSISEKDFIFNNKIKAMMDLFLVGEALQEVKKKNEPIITDKRNFSSVYKKLMNNIPQKILFRDIYRSEMLGDFYSATPGNGTINEKTHIASRIAAAEPRSDKINYIKAYSGWRNDLNCKKNIDQLSPEEILLWSPLTGNLFDDGKHYWLSEYSMQTKEYNYSRNTETNTKIKKEHEKIGINSKFAFPLWAIQQQYILESSSKKFSKEKFKKILLKKNVDIQPMIDRLTKDIQEISIEKCKREPIHLHRLNKDATTVQMEIESLKKNPFQPMNLNKIEKLFQFWDESKSCIDKETLQSCRMAENTYLEVLGNPIHFDTPEKIIKFREEMIQTKIKLDNQEEVQLLNIISDDDDLKL